MGKLCPVLRFRSGKLDPFDALPPVGQIGSALALQFKAETYHRIKRISESEVWILLGKEGRPSRDLARRLIIPAMRDELREKALYAAVIGGGLLLISFVLRMLPG